MVDILAAIDEVLGCQHCGGPLGQSPSVDFCSDDCQRNWHAAGSTDLPDADGAPAGAHAGFRLPRSTADLRSDWRAARRAQAAAATAAQHAAVRLRIQSLNERERAAAMVATAAMWPAMEAAVRRHRRLGDLISAVFREAGDPAPERVLGAARRAGPTTPSAAASASVDQERDRA